jgi:hypothetical protein
LPKWSKNDHFFEVKKKSPKHYFFMPKAIFSYFRHNFAYLGQFS